MKKVVMAPRKPMSSQMAIAMEEHDIKVLIQLITDGESVNLINGSTGEYLIAWAIENDYTDFARLLIDVGAKIEQRDVDCNTPLMLAARRGNVEIIGLLIERGAKLNRRNQSGLNALRHAQIGRNYSDAECYKKFEAIIDRDGNWCFVL